MPQKTSSQLSEADLNHLIDEARACQRCAAQLPHAPRPVLRVSSTARLFIVSQAPGTKVHETGIPWNDRSGDRLRSWLNLDRDDFYDVARVAIMPMGLCFPGQDAKGGDLPPRPECASHWHPIIRPHLRQVQLTLLIGQYAQRFYLRDKFIGLTETVRRWRDFLPDYLPLPHPSWRNTGWLKQNSWFERELLPVLRARVSECLNQAAK